MVSSTTCCISLQIFCLNLCYTSSRSVLPRMCMCACQTKKLILTSNELLKLLETTTDWHTNAFAHFWKYCHGTKFGKFHLECIPTSSGCSIRIFPMYRYKICNLLLFKMHTVFVQSFSRSFVHIIHCLLSIRVWNELLGFCHLLLFFTFCIYRQSWIPIKLESLRVRNVDDIVVHDSVNSNICVLFVVYGMFFFFEHIFKLSGIFAWNLIHFINSSHLINFIIRQNSIGIPIKIGPCLLATMFTSHRI